RQPACGLLGEISGVSDVRRLAVPAGACEACCQSFVPTAKHPNPVVASLLFQIAQDIGSGNVDRCDPSQAARLADLAKRHLPTLLPHEEDCVDDSQPLVPPRDLPESEIKRLVPVRHSVSGPVRRWAVGVTTAPRGLMTVEQSLDSFLASGWEQTTVFADGNVKLGDRFGRLPIKRYSSPSGAWKAWRRALQELVDQNAAADAVMLFQDDALFPGANKLRSYLESSLWPNQGRCIASLYSCADYTKGQNGWRALDQIWLLGAVAWVFPKPIAVELVKAIRRGELEDRRSTAGIDSRVGAWAWRNRIPFWFPTPSLVQHIGQVSSIWAASPAVGLRRADRFLLDEIQHRS
ncbi:MAG: hypothetical protein MI861_10590, partial [Pirellulales bacterium]|nr:hypothetical protein [Pirellulales bacterium]